MTPMLSIVATIYNKDVTSLRIFFDALKKQTDKRFELILVDDCSDVIYSEVIHEYTSSFKIEYVRMGSNHGQCRARNLGIRESSGPYICIVDSDCIPNAKFVEAHINELYHHEVKDVLIGAYNIESNGREIWSLIDQLQNDRAMRTRETNLQYPANPGYFLNFITRNISFKRGAIPPGGMFNEEYSYVGSNPTSGFGWEDVEAGWNLFKCGLHFSFTDEAFTVHLSHPSTTDPVIKPLRSFRNFNRLLLNHPEMVYTEAKPWILDTYGKIHQWFKSTHPTKETFKSSEPSWGVVVVELSPCNERHHPFVVESVLKNWKEGFDVYLVAATGNKVAAYHARLHSYVKHVQRPPVTLGTYTVAIHLTDDLILPEGVIESCSRVQPARVVNHVGPKPVLGGWQDSQQFFHRDLRAKLDNRSRVLKRRLKILTYRWHVGHQYELWKLPHDFYVAEDATTMSWDYSSRPFPKNAHFVKMDEINPRDYDIALLHFDENVVNPVGITNNVLHEGWGATFRRFLHETEGMPRVAICHGTPPFHGMFDVAYKGADLMEEWKLEADRVRRYVGDLPIICNSYNAWKQWRFPNSRVIWHGFDSTEYNPGTRSKGFVYSANSIRHRPWYRGYHEFKYLSERFPIDYMGRDDLNEFRVVTAPQASNLLSTQDRAIRQFQLYQQTLGDYTVFVNTTLRSPMPRTRSEAMLMGLCPVTMDYQDESLFITNGLNGFTGKTKEELAEHLLWCQRNMESARRIGMRGRETIRRMFTHTRYLQEWQETLYDLVGG